MLYQEKFFQLWLKKASFEDISTDDFKLPDYTSCFLCKASDSAKPYFSVNMYLLIPQFYFFTCLKTPYVLNYVPFWKDQRQNNITGTSIIY